MDSSGTRRYPQGMRLLSVGLLLTAALLAGAPSSRAAEAPVLAVLEHPGTLFSKTAKIRLQSGQIHSPLANNPQAVWTLLPGDTLKQALPPPERLIQLYQQAGNRAQILCTITVKYERTSGGWRPAFLINPQPLVAWDGQKLVPINTEETARGHIQILKANPANGDGFYPGFAFSFATGPTQIDAWEVQ